MRNHTGWLSVLSVLQVVLSILSAVLARHTTTPPSPWDEMLIKHKWDAIPDNWVSHGHPLNGTTIKLHIVLKANSEKALIDALHEVSHPRHPKYGAHLSREEAAELAAPHPDTLKLVFSWLAFNGVLTSSISTSHGGSWLTIAGVPISQANKLLGASYELYYHAWANETILRTVSYALPAALHMHVQTVIPTTAFMSTRLLQQTSLSHSGREAAPGNVTSGEPSEVLSRIDTSFAGPAFLRWLYRMPLDDPSPTDRNRLGIAGLPNHAPYQGDLDDFMTLFRSDTDPEIVSTIVTVVPVNGGVDFRGPHSKRAIMHTQYIMALTFPTPIEYYTIGGVEYSRINGPQIDGDSYFEWLRYMIKLENVPPTITVPYFTRELDLPEEYMKTVCSLFRDLALRGVSVLVSSGDHGVGPILIKGSWRDSRFSTTFPASCPYVTSVGGTTGLEPEVGSEISGGGFSYYFERPDYQNDAVPHFLQNLGSQYAGLYNPLGRGVPDIALQSLYYAVLWRGKVTVTNSTVFSTNTAAAMIALLNGYLVSNGKKPLGFLNYWLYETGLYWDGLNDITGGHNPGCDTEGFYATVGWDPITGLGSLNYTLLQQQLIKWGEILPNATQ